MGRINQGILGGFSGKVGTVIGSSWKGITFMRARAVNVKNPRTEKQVAQRTKFALTVRFLKPMTYLLRVGFKLYEQGQTAFNAAMSYTLAHAITGTYPDYSIDPSKVLISCGGLPPATSASVTATDSNIEFKWADNSGAGSARQTDMALIAIVNPAKGEAITYVEDAERMTGSQTVPLWGHWSGDVVHTYLGFVSEDGKEVSNSLYLGQITVGNIGNATNPGGTGEGDGEGDDEYIDPNA